MIYFGFWALLIATIVIVISQLHFLTMSLKIAPALLAIPVFHSVFIVLSIVGGGVYYNELQHMSGVQVRVPRNAEMAFGVRMRRSSPRRTTCADRRIHAGLDHSAAGHGAAVAAQGGGECTLQQLLPPLSPSRTSLQGSTPPSKFYLAGIIVRFLIRTRRMLRAEEADKWPNRLHLYSCDCGEGEGGGGWAGGVVSAHTRPRPVSHTQTATRAPSTVAPA